MSELKLIYVGQLREEKGIRQLVSAIEQLKAEGLSLHLTICGPTESWKHDSFPSEILNYVQNSPYLSEAVVFTGHVENVGLYFDLADLHIAPSIVEESFGLVVIEAKNNALPSVIYPSGGMVELVRNGVDGIVCSEKSPESLADAIRIFIKSPELINRMGAAAKQSLSTLGCDSETFRKAWLNLILNGSNELGSQHD